MKEPDFAFEKIIAVSERACGDSNILLKATAMLIQGMKETNALHGLNCEFFRLDFRFPYYDEISLFPFGSLVLDLKWGSKQELKDQRTPGK